MSVAISASSARGARGTAFDGAGAAAAREVGSAESDCCSTTVDVGMAWAMDGQGPVSAIVGPGPSRGAAAAAA